MIDTSLEVMLCFRWDNLGIDKSFVSFLSFRDPFLNEKDEDDYEEVYDGRNQLFSH